MLSMIFKFSLSFVVCFIILSFQINNKTIFNHLSEFTGPLGTDMQSTLQKSFKTSLKKSQEVGEDFFQNADPKYVDEIKSQKSSLNVEKIADEIILEDLSREEIKKLDEIINNN